MSSAERNALEDLASSRLRRRSITAAITCISVVGFGLSLTTPLLSFMAASRGISDTWIGLNTAIGGVAALAVAPFVTDLVRRVGTSRVIHLALALAAISLLLFEPSPFWAWFILRFLFTAAVTVLFVVSEFWINAVAPHASRGFVMGIYATALSTGFAAGPAILATFGSDSGAPLALAVGAIALAAVPVAIVRAAAPRVETRPSQRMFGFLLVAPAAMMAAFVFGASEQIMFAFMPLYGVRSGLAEASAVLLVAMAGIGNVLFQIPLGTLADRVDRNVMLAACGFVGFAGAAMLPAVVGTPLVAFALMIVWGGLSAGLYTVGLTQLGARFSGADLAAANSLFVMLYSFGMLVGPASAGAAFELWPPNGPVAVIAILFAAYTVVATVRCLPVSHRDS